MFSREYLSGPKPSTENGAMAQANLDVFGVGDAISALSGLACP
jgi:hypothetical protein